jgi:hypothetical protein
LRRWHYKFFDLPRGRAFTIFTHDTSLLPYAPLKYLLLQVNLCQQLVGSPTLWNEMSTTSAQDRLNRLFANSPRPPLPTPGQRHFSEVELEEKRLMDAQPWKAPATAEDPTQTKPVPKERPSRDILTSSDEDEYTSLFSKKPSMKPTKKSHAKPRKSLAPNSAGLLKDAIVSPAGSLEYLAKGKSFRKNTSDHGTELSDSGYGMLSTGDAYGNPVIARFCQFSLAAKFPYKYMNDPNDRVSRHYFASNKFYARKWDL